MQMIPISADDTNYSR